MLFASDHVISSGERREGIHVVKHMDTDLTKNQGD